jgi:hypothetical protein
MLAEQKRLLDQSKREEQEKERLLRQEAERLKQVRDEAARKEQEAIE